MTYTMADLEALTGLTARTIRDYIRHGYLAPPTGHGPGAVYDEEQMLRVVTVARMREQKQGWDKIAARLAKSSVAKLRAFVEQTEPKPPDAASPAAEADASPAVEGEPVDRALPPRHPEADTTTELDVRGDGHASALRGTRLVMEPVLPGLVLLVNEDAAPLVRRVVAEILATYRVSR
jgi:DNA-binding transcriptional MerR regulator